MCVLTPHHQAVHPTAGLDTPEPGGLLGSPCLPWGKSGESPALTRNGVCGDLWSSREPDRPWRGQRPV
ncbi:hypothetical protein GCM10010345_21470 [Streptomyces canarius]|uniref:Uncharacterized protein n=1 Tax=Streptomyces canarius TaxID=285453 RepID=A0ABQ3CHR6_9ACTN|nr:hypothetical protein GCM10010345_21470 [Streptomyces canarius]